MSDFTELIFGARLKKDTPKSVIDTLLYMVNRGNKPTKIEFEADWIFNCASYYFGVCKPVNKMWFDDISNQYVISIRSNIKNYENDIEKFLEWIKPYIDSGSGEREMYAIVIFEYAKEPTIYYLN